MNLNFIYLFQLPELEIENEKLKNDLKQLREALADDAGDNGHFKEMIDQYDHLQDELERRREECIQLRTVLANSSMEEQPFSLLSRASELPETEELFTAYETQKSVISQLQEQLSDEKTKAKELEAEMKTEIARLSRTNNEQQQVSQYIIY